MKYISLSALVFVLCLTSCKKEPEKTSWERVKGNALETYSSAKDLGEEKWDELKVRSQTRWAETSDRVVDLKTRAVSAGDELQPKIREKLAEIDQMLEQANQRIRGLSAASGEKISDTKETLESTWEKLKVKIEEVNQDLRAI